MCVSYCLIQVEIAFSFAFRIQDFQNDQKISTYINGTLRDASSSKLSAQCYNLVLLFYRKARKSGIENQGGKRQAGCSGRSGHFYHRSETRECITFT